jgi:hypothetical protein
MIVNMPDGTPVEFPDDMPKEQIKMLIARKYPDAIKQAQPTAQTNQDVGPVAQTAARLGRIGVGAASVPADLIYAAGALPYSAVRELQYLTGSNVAPEIPFRSPGEYARESYDKLTGGAGVTQGGARIADVAAEAVLGGGALGKAVPALASPTMSDAAANAAAGDRKSVV